ncbi:tryptophan synthase subunit alpha [Croceiramulus getboli]|nr:tryptophan synthase subunit alpha [Flavobacteriaceae bacterium YJPT1-3]
MNRINQKLAEDQKLLSIYFTAGYPQLEDTVPVLKQLQESGVDMVEIGLPFSDPLADGPTIQESSTQALKNGMSTQKLFDQLAGIREIIHIPLIVMGYFNPMLQYGVERFCEQCAQLGIDGIIMPDLPLAEYQEHYQSIFERHGLKFIFLITPQTSEARIRQLDAASDAFIYMVSSASTTGAQSGFGGEQQTYFERIARMDLNNPQIVGFGISNAETFQKATRYAKGAIIGSAFIKHLTEHGAESVEQFVKTIR